MSRSASAEREERHFKYSSARTIAEKTEAGFQGTYLKIPSGVTLYKPTPGKALLDVIPFVAGEGNPRADKGCLHYDRLYWAHRGIGPNQETFICPAQTAGQPCPICEERARLRASGEQDDEETAKLLLPKKRQLLLVIDRKKGDDAPLQLYDTSTFAFDDALQEAINSADSEEDKIAFDGFHSLSDGFTLRVIYEEEQIGRGQKFVKATRIDFKDREPYVEDVLDETFCLDDILIILPYEQLEKKFLVGAKDKASDDDAPPSRRRGRTAEPEEEEGTEAPPVRGRRGAPAETDPTAEEEEEAPRSRRGRAAEPAPEEEEEPPTRGRRGAPAAEPEEAPEKNGEDDWDRFSDKPAKGGKPSGKTAAVEEEEPPRRGRRSAPEPEPEEEEAPVRRGRGRPPGKAKQEEEEEAPVSRRGRR